MGRPGGRVPPRNSAGESQQEDKNSNARCFFYSCHIKYLFPGTEKKNTAAGGPPQNAAWAFGKSLLQFPRTGRPLTIRRPGNPHKEYHNVFRAF